MASAANNPDRHSAKVTHNAVVFAFTWTMAANEGEGNGIDLDRKESPLQLQIKKSCLEQGGVFQHTDVLSDYGLGSQVFDSSCGKWVHSGGRMQAMQEVSRRYQ